MSYYDSLNSDDKIKYHKLVGIMENRMGWIKNEYKDLGADVYADMLYKTEPDFIGKTTRFILVASLVWILPALALEFGIGVGNGIVKMAFAWVFCAAVWRYSSTQWKFKYCDSTSVDENGLRKFYRRIMKNGGFEYDKVHKSQKSEAA